MAVRLLSVLAGFVPWDGWENWEVHGGYLFPPGYKKNGIPPGEFFAVPFYRQSVSAYRERVEKLEDTVEQLRRELADAKQRQPGDPATAANDSRRD